MGGRRAPQRSLTEVRNQANQSVTDSVRRGQDDDAAAKKAREEAEMLHHFAFAHAARQHWIH